MPYDPMEGFQIGQAIGKSKRSAYGNTAQYMSDLTAERDKEKNKINPLELIMAKQAIQPSTGVYSWNPTSGNLEQQATVPKGSIVRNTTTEEDIANKAVAGKGAVGAGAESGKMAFVKVSLRDSLPSVKQTLFPDGTPKSFDRGAATQSTLMNGGPMPFSSKGQKVYRELGSALAARRFMITGQASNQTEVKEMVNQFMSQWGSDPDNMFQGINQIENEFNEYLQTVDPSGMFHQKDQKVNDPKQRLRDKLLKRGLL